VATVLFFRNPSEASTSSGASPSHAATEAAPPAGNTDGLLRLSADQQQQIGLRTAPVSSGYVNEILKAPGIVAPDETRYAFVTPRTAGVVRRVAARIGQEVKAGDLLVEIDSPEVAQARLDLVTRMQEMEIARAQADWQESIYRSTNELIAQLKADVSPERIHELFENRPIGETRERLITAYADYRLAKVTFERNKELQRENAISLSQYQQAQAEYQSAVAIYAGLMDRMGFEATLSYTKARQTRRQAETAVRVALERLRVLGIAADDAEVREVESRVGSPSKPPLTLSEAVKLDEDLSQGIMAAILPTDQPVSNYQLRAPFDGIILDRGVLVPGVAVDTTHRVFTLANLSNVWIEASVHESDFSKLAGTRDGTVTIRSRAYPDRVFPGKVLYTGDMVDEKSRMVKLLASAENADRLLKPGMFVEVEIESKAARPVPNVPETALLTEGDHSFVFIRKTPETFERRDVVLGERQGQQVAIQSGIRAGDEVVIDGSFKLKSEAMRLLGN
jgi:multidrug efflux pump subunit AcrA (membrane-fusion protein)